MAMGNQKSIKCESVGKDFCFANIILTSGRLIANLNFAVDMISEINLTLMSLQRECVSLDFGCGLSIEFKLM